MATARSRKKSEAPNQELINDLKSWARENGSTNDALVTELITDLEEVKDLSSWASLPTIELLPPINSSRADQKITIANRIAIIRNILVFVPVALTWIAVSKATDAFGQYTSANKSAVVNFLEFWQNGYGVLASEWTIGHVAFLDFAIISLVIVLSLTVSFMEIQHKKILSTEVAKRENERLALGIRLHKYLDSKKVSTPEVVNANVSASVRNLLATSKELAKTSKELGKDIKKVYK
ncbi:hypothetical protein MCEMRH37_01255 [Candidatus Nanopelagicaceae bacterium]